MRLLIGSVLRSVPDKKILYGSFILIFTALVVLISGKELISSYTGFYLVGAGLAGGFPIMLGFTGMRYAELSGTAFSIVLSIALIGNMSVNYLMGFIAKNIGIKHLTSVAMTEFVMLVVLAVIILKKINSTNK
jgi:fucose permease